MFLVRVPSYVQWVINCTCAASYFIVRIFTFQTSTATTPIFASSPSAFPTRMRVKHSRGRSPMWQAGFLWTLASWISLQIRAWRPSQPIGGVRARLLPLGQHNILLLDFLVEGWRHEMGKKGVCSNKQATYESGRRADLTRK